MFDFRKTSIPQDVLQGLNAGYPGSFGLKREPDFENHLVLYTQRRMAIVRDFLLDIQRSDGRRFQFDQSNFQGGLLMDSRGDKHSRVRLVMVDANGTIQLASDCDRMRGQVIVVADQAVSDDPKLFGVKALLSEDEEGSNGILLWDGSKELTRLWTMEARFMRGEMCAYDTVSI